MKTQRSRGPYSGAAGLVRGNRGLTAEADTPKSLMQMATERAEREAAEYEKEASKRNHNPY